MTFWTWADAHPAALVLLGAPVVVTACVGALMWLSALLGVEFTWWGRR